MADDRVHLLELAHRRSGGHAAKGSAISDMIEGLVNEEIAHRRGLPRAAVQGVRTFYDELGHDTQVCDGTACHFAGGLQLAERLRAREEVVSVRCLGHCFAPPSFRRGESVFARPGARPLPAWLDQVVNTSPVSLLTPVPRTSIADQPVVLRNLIGQRESSVLDEYDLPDGETILAALQASRLRGRGGAGFPTAAKWRAARDTAGSERYVVANGDEGDPGSFVDRLLLEEDPHAVLAGMLACARAIGGRHGGNIQTVGSSAPSGRCRSHTQALSDFLDRFKAP